MCGLWTTRTNEMRAVLSLSNGNTVQYLDGVKSSSHNSTPMHVSTVLTTQSPNGTLTYVPFRFKNGHPQTIRNQKGAPAYLAGDSLDDAGQVVVLPLVPLHPRREVAQLAIVAVVREPHLWADEKDLAVVDDHAAVVYHVLVYHRPVALHTYDTDTRTCIGEGGGGQVKNARTSRYRRECRLRCQRRVCSPAPPTNVVPCHLHIYPSSTHRNTSPEFKDKHDRKSSPHLRGNGRDSRTQVSRVRAQRAP